MKLFITKGYHLAALPVQAKLVYSVFLLFVAAGLWTSWAIYFDRIGGDLRAAPGQPSVSARYVASAPAPAAGGPALDLGDSPAPAAVTPAEDLKRPWILDVFHQHVFSVSVVFLILAHLFMLTRLRAALTGAVIAVAGLSSLGHVAAPVVIWKTGGWLWLMPATGAAMGVSWTLMVAWSFAAMWFGAAAPPTAREPRIAGPGDSER